MKKRLLFAAAILVLIGAVVAIVLYLDQDCGRELHKTWTPTKDSQPPLEIEDPVGTHEPNLYLVCQEVSVFSDPLLATEYLGTAPIGAVEVLEVKEGTVRIQAGDSNLTGWIERGAVSEACY